MAGDSICGSAGRRSLEASDGQHGRADKYIAVAELGRGGEDEQYPKRVPESQACSTLSAESRFLQSWQVYVFP